MSVRARVEKLEAKLLASAEAGCPMCAGEDGRLELVWEHPELVNGTHTCGDCGRVYPITAVRLSWHNAAL